MQTVLKGAGRACESEACVRGLLGGPHGRHLIVSFEVGYV